MKKLISLLICAVMLSATVFTAVPVSAVDYAGNLDFSLTNAAGMQNDEITIEFNLNENPGLAGFWFMIYYDSDAFILRKVTYSKDILEYGSFTATKNNLSVDELKGPVSIPTIERMKENNMDTEKLNYKVLYYDTASLTENVEYTGNVATLTFQIMGIAEDGDYTIGLMPGLGNFINIERQDLSVSWTNATVHVGSTDVPEETQKTNDQDNPVDPAAVETAGAKDTETEKATVDVEIETFTDDDGVIYIINNEGETEVYNPETSPEDVTEKETEADVEGEDKAASPSSTINLFGKSIPVIYIVLAIFLILVAVAAILFVIFSKTKKSNKE